MIPACLCSQTGKDSILNSELTTGSGTFYSIGFGTSVFFNPGETDLHGNIFGYYMTASVTKSISKHFNVSSGIDAYSIPHFKNRVIGQLNLNTAYVHHFGKNINMSIGTGLFTGFTSRNHTKQTGGFVSGLLLNSTFRYKISRSNSLGIGIKYPILTENTGILLSNVFFAF